MKQRVTPSNNRRQPGRSHRQQGLVMIAMLLLVFMAGTSMFFVAMSDRQGDVKKMVDYNQEMVLAKEALITFAANYPDLYPGEPNNGPGRLPCPDNSLDGQPGDGQPVPSCNGGVELTYRLPVYANTLNSGQFYFSRQFIEASQETDPDKEYSQFWYALSNGYATDDSDLNSSVDGKPPRLRLDNTQDYVALIIAPGNPLTAQSRSTENARNNRDNYLEAPNNSTDTGMFSNYPEDPESLEDPENSFNDRVIGITRSELMSEVTFKVATEVKKVLDRHHDPGTFTVTNNWSIYYQYECMSNDQCYPRDDIPEDFWGRGSWFGLPHPNNVPRWDTVMEDAIDDDEIAAWYEDDNWHDVIEYEKISDDEVELQFEDCAIVYTLRYGSEPEIERSDRSC